MDFTVVAKVVKDGKVVGVSLYDIKNNSFDVVDIRNIKTMLESGSKIDNLGINDGELVVINGSMDDYHEIKALKNIARLYSLMVLAREEKDVYIVRDNKGEILRLMEKTITDNMTNKDILNAQIVTVPVGGGSLRLEKKIRMNYESYDDVVKSMERERKKIIEQSKKSSEKINTKMGLIGGEYYIDDNLELKVFDGAQGSSLRKLIIPDAVRIINKCDKGGFSSVEEIGGGKGLVKLGVYTFSRCQVLKDVDLSESSLDEIPRGCFNSSTSLERVKLPDTLKTIGKASFAGTALREFDVPDSTTKIMNRAFASCGELTKINWGSQLKLIGDSAFTSSGIEEIVLPPGVVMVGSFAFYNCNKLRYLYIPDTVKTLRYDFLGPMVRDRLELELPERLLSKALKKHMSRFDVKIRTY